MTASQDITSIDPVLREVTLTTGHRVLIESLKTRQFFRLLKILTRGAGPLLMEYRLDGDISEEEFTGRLVGLVLLSVPEAETEAIDFLRSMVKPADLIERPNLSKGDRERNAALWDDLDTVMNNPELEDTLTLIERIVRAEAKDIKSLGKRLQAMFRLAERTGQMTPERPLEPSEDPIRTPSTSSDSIQTDSLEDSLAPSTS